MAIAETSHANGAPEVERLQIRVRDLERECAILKETLAKAESEREAYRQLFLEEARERREFEDADLATLEATSPGPVDQL